MWLRGLSAPKKGTPASTSPACVAEQERATYTLTFQVKWHKRQVQCPSGDRSHACRHLRPVRTQPPRLMTTQQTPRQGPCLQPSPVGAAGPLSAGKGREAQSI